MVPWAAILLLLCTGCGGPALVDSEDAALRATAFEQFGGGFKPRDAPWGGFGGGACKPARTPVLFLHGNSERAGDWNRSSSAGGRSVYAEFIRAGYQPCELFGLTWLSPLQQATQQDNVHDAGKARRVGAFIADVLAYTGGGQIDLIGHSMGVTVGMHALDYNHQWPAARRIVAIAGALRGLQSCVPYGPADPFFPVCGGQNLFDPELFGFYPAYNQRMQAGGFSARAAQHPTTRFAAITAGASDEFLCPGCSPGLFDSAPGVSAQLDVGVGAPLALAHDDSGGVGHFRARTDTGRIQVNLLTTSCAGAACCAGYAGSCR